MRETRAALRTEMETIELDIAYRADGVSPLTKAPKLVMVKFREQRDLNLDRIATYAGDI